MKDNVTEQHTKANILGEEPKIFEMYTDLDNKKYEEKFVCFLDVLGFSEQSKKSENPSDVALPILILQEFKDIVERSKKPLYVSSFSDCVYVVANKDDADELLEFVAMACFTALTYSTHEVKPKFKYHFLRGGITFGKIYYDDGVLLGPAMIKAYKLEKKAKYPRVVVDDVAKKVFDTSKYTNYIISNWNESDVYYIDFLTFIHCNNDLKNRIPKGSIDEIFDWVKGMYEEYSKCECTYRSLKNKYGWFAEYLAIKMGALNIWGETHGEENQIPIEHEK